MDEGTDSLPPELRCTGQKLSDNGAYVVGKCCITIIPWCVTPHACGVFGT